MLAVRPESEYVIAFTPTVLVITLNGPEADVDLSTLKLVSLEEASVQRSVISEEEDASAARLVGAAGITGGTITGTGPTYEETDVLLYDATL